MTGVLLMALLSTAPKLLDGGLWIGGVFSGGASAAVSIDAVQAALAERTWRTPAEGDTFPGSHSMWQRVPSPDKTGTIQIPDKGVTYYFATYQSPAEEVLLLSAEGAGVGYVNGLAVVGDPYGYRTVKKPVLMKRGDNEFLFGGVRGDLKPVLEKPGAPLLLGPDLTIPDLLAGRKEETVEVGLQLINATAHPIKLTKLQFEGRPTPVDLVLAPLAIRKVGLRLPVRNDRPEDAIYRLEGPEGMSVSFKIPFRTRKEGETYKATFRSGIDGSVQYYAVRPALNPRPDNALVLSLHGASVEAIGQAEAYGPKSWASIVCPTNRRPYGFDWEDWGRLDALEVLEQAKVRLPHDPSRTVLTGHSMGGHGTWQIGTMYPDKFAAIGASAGWVSYQSYRIPLQGEHVLPAETEPQKCIAEASLGSDTVARVRNLSPLGVYILHGKDDDNVPIGQARMMRDALAPFHKDFTLWEQPQANHWWNVQDEPGASCVDWPPMFDLFARRRIPRADEIRDLEFRTVAPNLSSDCHWVRIEQQVRPFQMSTIQVHVDPNLHRIEITTDNVSALSLKTSELFKDDHEFKLVVDGQTLSRLKDHDMTLRRGAQWAIGPRISSSEKNPSRGGGFKEALSHQFIVVYGTHGSPEENRWMSAKAQFDAEGWWYRGNGDIELVKDDDYLPERFKGRDVLLIGNSEINSAWSDLLKGSRVSVTSKCVKVGTNAFEGEDKMVLFCRPTAGGMVACVGVTGYPSMRLSERLAYLASGVGFPDYTVLDVGCLRRGTKGILAAGWFGNDWKLP